MTSQVTDNKKFWNTIKPFFSDKTGKQNKNTLIESTNEELPEKIISDEKEVSEIFNEYFVNISNELGLHQNLDILRDTNHVINPHDKAVEMFKTHPNIVKIQNNNMTNLLFVSMKLQKIQ